MEGMWYKIILILFLGYMFYRILPSAIHWVKHGPYGSSKEWLNVSMLLGAVVLFVTFLITTVRN